MLLAKNTVLLEQFRAGSPEAMEKVYLHYHPGVQRFLGQGFTFRSKGGHCHFRGIKDKEELDSAIQQVFRRAFEDRARHTYNGINSFSNWVLAISRNMVINGFRNREIAFSNYISVREGENPLATIDNAITEEYTGILYGRQSQQQDKTFENSELKKLISKFMLELTNSERQLLILRFVEGIGQEETARQLDSSRMKIRTAESKLRRRLRAFLQDSGYIDNLAHDKTP